MDYEAIIGLEIHSELKTKTKMFCYSLNDPDERHPNLNICPICMGHPGTLPVINREAVKKVILTGLALGGKIAEFSQFDRKNYFYPDLPKGYQISQYKNPLVTGGYLEIPAEDNLAGDEVKSQRSKVKNVNQNSKARRIRITRVHLEEDTGRLIHDPKTGDSLVDFNRAGVPLMELVTEPDLRSGEEVKKFGEELQKILRYLEVSDADMEKGQLRVEVNISLRPETTDGFGTKVEIKNINSFKFAADAVDYEIKRQAELLRREEKIIQETRGWDEKNQKTFSQRSKEEAHDYRYFPEPDLPPLKISPEFAQAVKISLPELPQVKLARFISDFGLPEEIAEILTREKPTADYFEETLSELAQRFKEDAGKTKNDLAKTAALFMATDFLRLLNVFSASVKDGRISAENFAELISFLAEDKISGLAAKKVLEEMFRSGDDPSDLIERLGLWQVSDASDLENIARHILKENPKAIEDYRNGKEGAAQFLVGQIMKESRGKANPKITQEIIRKILENE